MAETALMAAQSALAAAGADDDAARLTFYSQLAEAELVVLLSADATDASIAPRVFALDAGRFVLAFDSEAALADFADGPAPYAALPGRELVAMLAGQGVGLAVNPQTSAAQLLAPDALDWLAGALRARPSTRHARPAALHPPAGLPEELLVALDAALARAAGLASGAYLARTTHEDAPDAYLLAFLGAAEAAQPALARAANRAVTFSGAKAVALDLAFVAPGDARLPALARVALWFDMAPLPPEPTPEPGAGRPPRLR